MKNLSTVMAVMGGLVTTIILHGIAWIVVNEACSFFGAEGEFWAFSFFIAIGLVQWVYLAPAVLVARSLGFNGVARGIWIGGIPGVLLSVVFFLSALSNSIPAALEGITGNTRARTEYAGRDGFIVSATPEQIEVRYSSAPPETFRVNGETKFAFRGPAWRQQTRPAGLEWLTSNRRVSVSYVLRDHRQVATYVTIWVAKPES